MDLQREVQERGALAATHELLRAGATSRSLTRAVRAGALIRVRQGWYGLPGADPVMEAGVRVGGRITCITAARSFRMWAAESTILHVRVPDHGSRLRAPDDMRRRLVKGDSVRIHWRRRGQGTRHRVTPEVALTDMIGCQSIERIVAAADSAIRLGLISRSGWKRLVRTQPRGLRSLLLEADGVAESILESVFCFRLRRRGYLPRRQIFISGVGRVDLILGRRLVIELDGWEFHATREAFEEDRRRDAELARRGYLVLRFTYRQLTRHWHRTLGIIRDCLALG